MDNSHDDALHFPYHLMPQMSTHPIPFFFINFLPQFRGFTSCEIRDEKLPLET
jgi:hypothetical protein